MSAITSQFHPDTSGAENPDTRPTARTQGSTPHNGSNGARTFEVVLETPDGVRRLRCGEGSYVLDCALAHDISLPSICRQGWCLTCAGALLSGAVDASDARAYYPEDKAAGFVLICCSKPRSDLRIRTHQAGAMRRRRQALNLPAPYA